MSKSSWLLGFAGATFLKTAIHALDWAIKIITSILVFFGLYIPFTYLVYGGLLQILAKVNLFDFSTNSQLYYLGLLLCLICAIIISIRNLLMRPLTSVIAWFDRKNQPEQPMIYRSKIMKDLIIYEYKDKYDVYREKNGRLGYLRTDRKGKRHR